VRDEHGGETIVEPAGPVPLPSLVGVVIGTPVELAGGSRSWAVIGNVDAGNPRRTEQFIAVSIEREGRWFSLARYHDFDYDSRGPQALADFLGLSMDDVFPISYDLTAYAIGSPESLAGTIPREPRVRLSRTALSQLAVGELAH
jgi:hypothetical protein